MKRILLITIFIWISSLAFSQLSVTVNQQNVTCFGLANGSATVNATGGTPAYTYTWLPGGQTTSSVSNLVAGQYTVIVQDAALAINSQVFVIFEPSQLSVSTQVFLDCNSPCSNQVLAIVAGGTAPYSYAWSNGAVTQQTVGALCAGNYSVQITDANGCVDTSSFIVSYGPSITIAETHVNTPCSGLCNGIITFTVTGGSGHYSYNWFEFNTPWPGTLIPSPNQYSLCAGAYTLTVTDSITGCANTSTINISPLGNGAIPNLTVTSLSYDESCNLSGDGMIDLTISGSNSGPFTYLWSNGATTQDINNIASGNYWVTVVDANTNCTTVFDTIFSINSIPNVTVSSLSADETCLLTGDGSIDVTVSGSNPGPFTYLWSSGTTTQDIYNISSGSYSLTVTDANNNCVVISDTVHSIGINCGSISGHVYIDNTNDCSFNAGDGSSFYSAVSIQPGNRVAYTDNSGNFSIANLSYGTYSVSLISGGYIYMSPACGTTLNININSSNANSINNELPVGFSSSTQPDVYVGAYSNGIVPGFASHVTYNLGNLNNVNASGTLKITLPPNYTSAITTVSPSPQSISGDTIIWNFNNANYYGSIIAYGTNYYVEFITPVNTPLGSVFTSSIFAQPNITDLNNANNITYYQRLVTGAFDPNAKTVSPAGNGANGEIPDTQTDLTYLIQFQNTGNGPAVNIVVKDTLSPNVDINTFQMVNASHNYNIDILPGNVLRWKFNNIMLADSGSNELASHGYIQYRIKRNNVNTPGTQIKNTAYIYFDFNEPVVTNTAINTIESFAGISSHVLNNNYCSIYPNPASSVISIKLSGGSAGTEDYSIKITDVLTREVLVSDYKEQIDISNLEKGIYLTFINFIKTIR